MRVCAKTEAKLGNHAGILKKIHKRMMRNCAPFKNYVTQRNI